MARSSKHLMDGDRYALRNNRRPMQSRLCPICYGDHLHRWANVCMCPPSLSQLIAVLIQQRRFSTGLLVPPWPPVYLRRPSVYLRRPSVYCIPEDVCVEKSSLWPPQESRARWNSCDRCTPGRCSLLHLGLLFINETAKETGTRMSL